MKLQDFDFRVWYKNHQDCLNKDCKCQSNFIYGNEAKIRLSEFKEDDEIELWSGFYDRNGKKFMTMILCFLYQMILRNFYIS